MVNFFVLTGSVMKALDKVYPENFDQSTLITVDQLWLEGILILKSLTNFCRGIHL